MPWVVGPKVRVRTSASGLAALRDSPLYGLTSSTTRASANGARAGGGSASIWGWEYSSVVTWYIPRGLRSDPGAAAGLGQ